MMDEMKKIRTRPSLDALDPSLGALGPSLGALGPSLGALGPSLGALITMNEVTHAYTKMTRYDFYMNYKSKV